MNNNSSAIPKATQSSSQYLPPQDYWDEAVLPSGHPRRHWRKITAAVGRMGLPQLARAWQAGCQIIQDTGIAYNLGSSGHSDIPLWRMDPIPLLMSAVEWSCIEEAIIQRAALLNSIVEDLYGPRKLIHERKLHSTLLFDNPLFLRPCNGVSPVGGKYIRTYAADLVRSSDGTWRVLCDRTQAPEGMGYALANRMVSARTLPSLFSRYHIRQLTRFFDVRRNALLEVGSNRGSTPRIVLMTAGSHNEAYFEHSSLAGHWAFPLVQGEDLTVRDSRVFLRTLGGLEPVDVILRQMEDEYCDPLELKGDSQLGVPGLLHAVRSGQVAVDNALGSGIMETPSYMAFTGDLCQHMLGEALRIPSIKTWWCGRKADREYVLDHLDQLIIGPAFKGVELQQKAPALLSRADRKEMAERIAAQPERYVGQEILNCSTVPVFVENKLVPQHLVLRVFAAWDGQGYTVLPGGLARLSSQGSSAEVSSQLGSGSKDTWVLGDPETAEPVPVPIHLQADFRTRSASLPSRIADNLFWLGRYAERVESCIRLVRALLPALSREADFGRAVSLEIAVGLLSGMRYLPAELASASIGERHYQVRRLLANMIHDSTRTGGLSWNLHEMCRVAWHLKERLSADTWRVLQKLRGDVMASALIDADQRYSEDISILDGAIVTLSSFSGLMMENTTRGHGWRFLEMGKRLERALQILELLHAGMVENPSDTAPYLQLLLQIADSTITYRTRYMAIVNTNYVLELLLSDETNPRSVAFQLESLLEHVSKLPEHETEGRYPQEQRIALKALTAVRLASMQELASHDSISCYASLNTLLESLKADLYGLSDTLTAQFLRHVAVSRFTTS